MSKLVLVLLIVSVAHAQPVAPPPPPILPVVASAEVPFYPPLARVANVAGEVKLTVTTDGQSVTAVRIESGHQLLAAAAEQNVKTWKFRRHEPATFDVRYRYVLSREAGPNHPVVLLRLPTYVEITARPPETAVQTDWHATPVEVWTGGDDRLTQLLRDALEERLSASPQFTLSRGQRPGSLMVTIPTHVGWERVKERTKISFAVEFGTIDSRNMTSSAGSCWEDELEDCVDQIMEGVAAARKFVRSGTQAVSAIKDDCLDSSATDICTASRHTLRHLCGVIVDPSGSSIPNASISIRKFRGQESIALSSTNANGEFSIPNLPSGEYEVAIEAAGFGSGWVPVIIRRPKAESPCKTALKIGLAVGQGCTTVSLAR